MARQVIMWQASDLSVHETRELAEFREVAWDRLQQAAESGELTAEDFSDLLVALPVAGGRDNQLRHLLDHGFSAEEIIRSMYRGGAEHCESGPE